MGFSRRRSDLIVVCCCFMMMLSVAGNQEIHSPAAMEAMTGNGGDPPNQSEYPYGTMDPSEVHEPTKPWPWWGVAIISSTIVILNFYFKPKIMRRLER